MPDPKENVRRLREAYRLWHETRGTNANPWLELMADDVIIRSLAEGIPGQEWSRSRRGKSEAAQYFADMVSDWEMMHYTPEEFIAEGDRVVMLGRCAFKSRCSGKVAESRKADVFRFREGRIVEFLEFYDTHCVQAAAQPG